MFGPSDGALSGSGWVSINTAETPSAAAVGLPVGALFAANHFDQRQIGLFVIAANIIGLANAPVLQNGQQRIGMVINIKPVAHIQTITMNRHRFAGHGFEDNRRDQLFRKLAGAVIIVLHERNINARFGKRGLFVGFTEKPAFVLMLYWLNQAQARSFQKTNMHVKPPCWRRFIKGRGNVQSMSCLVIAGYGFKTGISVGTRGAPRISKRPFMEKPTFLRQLEAESIYIIREVVAQFENPVLLYSIGKDSAVLLHLAMKAFAPGPLPFPLLHVDTGWKFKEMISFRDALVKKLGLELIVHTNAQGRRDGVNPFDHGSALYTDVMKTQALKEALAMHGFDAAFGGARRDEEASRAKERVFSFRSKNQRWDAKRQRPELWRLYNGRIKPGESIRAFPLSNWTEADVWRYIALEDIPLVPLYFAKKRPVVARDGLLIMVDDARMTLKPGEHVQQRKVRFRTLGCYPLTAAVESEAATLEEVIDELEASRHSERHGRLIDHDQSGSMEKKKQEGYF